MNAAPASSAISAGFMAAHSKIFNMPAPRFVHLRLHSEYSVSDGIVRLDEA
jgi:hypothetical protein